MTTQTVRNRYTQRGMHSGEAKSIRDFVAALVKSGADLSGALYKGIVVKKLFVLSGLYKYTTLAIIAEDDSVSKP